MGADFFLEEGKKASKGKVEGVKGESKQIFCRKNRLKKTIERNTVLSQQNKSKLFTKNKGRLSATPCGKDLQKIFKD